MIGDVIQKHPPIIWTQHNNKLFLTVEVEDMEIDNLICDGNRFFIRGTNKSGKSSYEADFELYAPIDGTERHKIGTARQLELIFPAESTEQWPRLLKAPIKIPWLRIDFNKWIDSDDSIESENSNERHDFIDYRGNLLVLENFHLMLKLESSMWILSTLGGGFSSLADCGLTQFAEYALSVSKKQLKLARHIGDDVLLARCYVYIGFAYAQLKNFKEAFQILLYCRKIAMELKSQLLEDLSAALYMKIKLLSLQHGDQIVNTKRFTQLYAIYEGSN